MDRTIYDILKDKVIAISISESEDIFRLGYGKCHLQDAKVEIARYLLSCGCTLMYGGDLRVGGFTKILFDLVEAYSPLTTNTKTKPRLISYLSWPNDSELSENQEASLSNKVRIIRSGLPPDIKGKLRTSDYINPGTSEKYFVWARSLTHMREGMVRESDARIVLGGSMSGYKGKYPGIVEEVYLSMKAKTPVYLIGAFGGAASDIGETLIGNKMPRLTEKYQFKNKVAQSNAEYFNLMKPSNEPKINYEDLSSYFSDAGVAGLKNALTPTENKILLSTPHIPEMISLIVKGLVKKFNS